MAARDLLFNFIGDSKSLERASQKAGASLDKTGSKVDKIAGKMSKFGKGLTAGVTLPIIGVLGLGFKSLAENEVLMAQTNAVIESMGGSANKTADEVFDLANEISALSGLAHENVVEGENMLLTFGNITNQLGEGNDIFDQTARIMADMSVATGQDMKAAAVGLGKALNDPILGITALAKQGVQFTEAQKEQIKVLVESGDVMGAQKIILGELENQFGGSAAALGDTMTGSINKMKNSFEELARNLAEVLVPVMELLVGWLQKGLSWINNLSPGAQKFVKVLVLVAAAVGPVLIVGSKLIKAFAAVKKAFIAIQIVMAANPFILLIAAIIAIVILIVLNWDKIVAFLKVVWDKIKEIFSAAVDFLIGVIEAYIGIWIDAWEIVKSIVLGAWEAIVGFLGDAWEKIKETFQKAIDFLIGLVEFYIGIYVTAWQTIVAIIQGAIDTIRRVWDTFVGIVKGVLDRVKRAIDTVGGAITTAIQTIIDGWTSRFQTAWDFITSGFDTLVGFLTGLPGRVTSAVSGLFNGVKEAFRGSVNWIIRKWNGLALTLGGATISLPFGRSFTVPSVTLRTPNIPLLHTGGTFHAPRPGGEGLALLRDRERITAAGSSGPMIVQLVVDARVLAEVLIRHEESLA